MTDQSDSRSRAYAPLTHVVSGVANLVQTVEDIERLWSEDPTSGHVLVMLRELRVTITEWMEVLRARASST